MVLHTIIQNRLHRTQITFCLLVGTIVLLSLLAAPVAAAKLATPTLISPANNQHFMNIGGYVFMTWKTVPGSSVYYTVEVEFKPKTGGAWLPDPDFPRYDTPVNHMFYLWSTSVLHRWRVTAKDGSGVMGPSTPSAWRTFDYTPEKMQLATPVQTAPPNGAFFYNTATMLNWNLVPGAEGYRVEVQAFDPVTKTWLTTRDTTIGNGYQEYDFFTYPGSMYPQGRWRVTALNYNGWQYSKPSGWRTITYKV